MTAKAVKFELAPDIESLRHCVGGAEISIDTGGSYQTSDPHEIAALDDHQAVKRAKKEPSA